MAVHWKIEFLTLRSQRQMTVKIYDDSYTGDVIPLRGGAQPFITMEDNDDDWFIPIRKQTGYINIVDNGYDLNGNAFDWKDLIPATAKSHRVELVDGADILWQGYMQPQTFSGRLYESTQERQYPIMCGLSALTGVDVNTAENGVVTFAYLIDYLLQQTGLTFTAYDFQSEDAIGWLQKLVDWENFVTTDEDGNREASYDCLTLLEEICRFWGWTLRTYQQDLYFVNPDDRMSIDFVSMDAQGWAQLVGGNVPQYQDYPFLEVSTNAEVYASTNNDVMILNGLRKASVKANINKQEVVKGVPYDYIYELNRANQVTDTQYGGNGHQFWLLHYSSPNWINYTYGDVYISNRMMAQYIGASFVIEEYYEGSLNYKHNYDFKTSLEIRGDSSNISPYYVFRMMTRSAHNYDHGVFVISGNVSQVFVSNSQKQTYNANGYLVCRLCIGSNWWNGSSWQDSEATFNIPIGDEENGTQTGEGSIINNRVLDGPYEEYDGYGAPIDSAIGGVVNFQIVGVHLDDDHGFGDIILLDNLKLEFVRMKSYDDYSNRAENEYTQETNAAFTDERNVSTIFATDNNNAFGIGIVMNANGTYCDEVGYIYEDNEVYERPEEHLLGRIVARGSTVKYSHNIDILSNQVSINPYTICHTVDMDGYPVSSSVDWINDVETVKIIQL